MKSFFFILLIQLMLLSSTTAQDSLVMSLNQLPKVGLEDSTIINTVFTSLLEDLEENESWYGGLITYAPDSAFKIFVFSGESCGAYCQPRYYTFFESANNPQNEPYFTEAYDFQGEVDSIIKVENGKYLIFTQYGGRARSIESMECISVTLISLEDSLEQTWDFSICTSNLVSEDRSICSMTYNKHAQQIFYRYKYYSWADMTTTFLKSGSWQYKNGSFPIQNEKTEYQYNKE